MIEKGRINWTQFAFLVITTRLVITITYLPAFTSPGGKQDIWLAIPIIFPIVVLMATPLLILARKFPKQTIIQYSVTLLGRPLGKIIGLLYIWFFISQAAIILRLFSEFILNTVLRQTPLLIIIMCMMILASYAIRSGLEVIGRLGVVIGYFTLFSITILFFLLLKDIKLENFFPILKNGFPPLLHNSFTSAVRNGEILFIAMLAPFLNNKNEIVKGELVGLIILHLFYFPIEIPVVGLIKGLEAYPYYMAIRLVQIGQIIERIEVIHLGIWVFGTFISITMYYYLATIGIAQFVGLKNYKPLVFPLGAIIISLAISMFDNSVAISEFTNYKVWTPYGMFYLIVLPLLLFLVSLVRKECKNTKANKLQD